MKVNCTPNLHYTAKYTSLNLICETSFAVLRIQTFIKRIDTVCVTRYIVGGGVGAVKGNYNNSLPHKH